MPYGLPIPDLTRTELVIIAAAGLTALGLAVLAVRRYRRAEDARSAGEAAGAAFAADLLRAVRWPVRYLSGAAVGVSLALSRFFPKSERLWRGVTKRGLRGIYKTASGDPDAIGFIHRETGELDIKPVKWVPAGSDDPEQPPHWKTKDDETWHPGTQGLETEYIGRVPVALFDEDSPVKGSFLQSRFQQALDLGHKDKLFVPELVEKIEIHGHVEDIQDFAAGGDAVADGGSSVTQSSYEIPDSQWPDKLADVLVDLGSPGDHGGLRVSVKQAKEAFQENVGSEEMQMQEFRGRVAEADPSASKAEIKRLIYAILGTALVVKSPEILQVIFGSGAGQSLGEAVPSFTVLPPVWDLLAVIPL